MGPAAWNHHLVQGAKHGFLLSEEAMQTGGVEKTHTNMVDEVVDDFKNHCVVRTAQLIGFGRISCVDIVNRFEATSQKPCFRAIDVVVLRDQQIFV